MSSINIIYYFYYYVCRSIVTVHCCMNTTVAITLSRLSLFIISVSFCNVHLLQYHHNAVYNILLFIFDIVALFYCGATLHLKI
jgi:hypothetical protein